MKTILDDLYRMARDYAVADVARLPLPGEDVPRMRRALACLVVVEAAGSNLIDAQVAPVLLGGIYTRLRNDPEMWR